jgi:RNA polymerase sigma-70 factor (ECF subfamily)
MGRLKPVARQDLAGLNERYRHALLAFFTRRLRNHAEAEDLTQEVFARLAVSRPEAMDNPDAYIFNVAANLLRDKKRRERVRFNYRSEVQALDVGGHVEAIDPARVLVGRESLMEAAAALEAMPARTRAIFLLFRLEHLRQAEIAELYGISVSAVQKHLVRATAALVDRRTKP